MAVMETSSILHVGRNELAEVLMVHIGIDIPKDATLVIDGNPVKADAKVYFKWIASRWVDKAVAK